MFLIFKYKIYIILNIPFKLHTSTYDLDTTMIPTSVSFSSHIWEVEIKNKTEEASYRQKTKREKKANGKSKEKLANEKKYINRESENECIDKMNNEL